MEWEKGRVRGEPRLVDSLLPSVVSWNARGLICNDRKNRNAKLKFLSESSRGADVVFVQETHASETRLVQILRPWMRDFVVVADSDMDDCNGGAAIMLRKSWVRGRSITSAVIEKGRVLSAVVQDAKYEITLVNMHFHGLSGGPRAHWASSAAAHVHRTREVPERRFLILGATSMSTRQTERSGRRRRRRGG